MLKKSKDDGKTWSESVGCVPPSRLGYYVVNNDRLVQLKNGRLMFPAAYHRNASAMGFVFVFYSDDNGKTWKESPSIIQSPEAKSKTGLQEPGIIELSDNTLMLWARTDMGYQYKSFSHDGGLTWEVVAKPAKEFLSPASPLSMKRNPIDSSLVAVWCDKSDRWKFPKPEKSSWSRTPFVMAFSYDDAKTWQDHTVIESDIKSGYCYTAILFEDNSLLLAYCCGGDKIKPLQASRIRKIDFKQPEKKK